jgi:propanol-preferring alcohol dehydrogenase
VANLTREDGLDFFANVKHVQTERTLYPLERANEALDSLRSGTLTGTAVLEVA